MAAAVAGEAAPRLSGLLLAAGAGSRRGEPKALARDAGGWWLTRAVTCLHEGGCDEVVVVLGAGAEQARRLLEPPTDGRLRVVEAADWRDGLSASLRSGLRELAGGRAGSAPAAAVVSLVDLVDLTPAVVRRVCSGADVSTLARATYAGRPGHPVVLGRDHWADVADSVAGDSGARDFLAGTDVRLVECADLAEGRDEDGPPA